MALYKQPYGSAMQKKGDERRDGIFAKIKAKIKAKNNVKDTKESMGHNVKEEKRVENKVKADEITKKEQKTTIPENAKLTIESSNSGISPEAQKIVDNAGNTGHSGFTVGNNPNSGGYAPGEYVNVDRSNVSGAPSWMDVTRQSDLDNSKHVEGKLQAYTGKTTSVGLTSGTIGKVGSKDGPNAAFDLNARFGETTVRNPATYSNTYMGKGIGVGTNNTQIKYRMPGTGTFSDKGFGFNADGGFRISNNNMSFKAGAGYSSLMPKGSRGYGFVEAGLKGDLLNMNKIKKKNFYSAGNMNLSMPFDIKARAATGATTMNTNSLNKNSGIGASLGLKLSNVAKDRSIELGLQKDFQNSGVNAVVKAAFGIGTNKNDKREKFYE